MARRHAERFCAAAVLLLAACGGTSPEPPPPITIGLVTSLPVYWPEQASLSELVERERVAPWPRQVIEQHHRLVPLDTLAPREGLAALDLLILAQPRPLSPPENVALDDWVRDGGQAVMFADPALTLESRFPLGDPRRPQDVALLSPILSRWGLVLQFAGDQPEGERLVDVAGLGPFPVNLPGRFAPAPQGAGMAGDSCRIEAEGLVARCRIGRGRVLAIADAALFEEHDGGPGRVRQQALEALIGGFARRTAGIGRDERGRAAAPGRTGQTERPEPPDGEALSPPESG